MATQAASSRPTQNAIAQAFERCRSARRAAFIPFLVAGDPSLEATERLLPALVAGGADLIELGVPFSDPIADGPVNQRAAARALAAGATLSGILALVARTRSSLGVPIVLFSYYNPIHSRGLENFAEQAALSGVDGVLCVDLPPEEGGPLRAALDARGIASIQLLAPTSTKARIAQAGKASRGFVYYVSRAGVTGEQASLQRGLAAEVRAIRQVLRLPLAVGFGISSARQVEAVGRIAEGVVVGSALVRFIEEHACDPRLPELVQAKARELAAPLRG
jgi:tryptophan synthase alpha chain